MKKVFFFLILFFLCVPRLQELFKFFYIHPLYGVTQEATLPEMNRKDWLDGTFQKNFDEYYDQNFGFRTLFVRLFNQLDYSLFKKINVDAIPGKDGYFFQGGYLDEITGKNFIGDDKMKENIDHLKRLQNYFDSKNILLVTVLAPSKTYCYHDFLPDNTLREESPQRNYFSLLKYCQQDSINYIDLNKWFVQIKDTSRYPLFSKVGIHWGYYGMALCADSIKKYIEHKLGIEMPEITWTLDHPDKLRGTDYDLGEIMNVLERLPHYKMVYPIFEIRDKPNSKKIRLLVNADSFYWTIYNEKVFRRSFEKETFFYYCSSIRPEDAFPSDKVVDLDIIKEVNNYNVIVLLQSSANYGNPGANFIQYFNHELQRRSSYRDTIVKRLTDIYPNLVQENRIPMLNFSTKESAISFLADSLTQVRFDRISKIKFQMRRDPDWYKQIVEKAKDSNLSVEAMMDFDANWLCDQDDEKYFQSIR